MTDIQTCDGMLMLKLKCVHPKYKRPYINGTGGKDCSTEGLQGGLTHCFVFHFDNKEDLEYYMNEDPAHLAFKKSLEGVVEKATVVDYEPSKF